MSAKVIEVRQISKLLLDDLELMKRWKAASKEGKVQARSIDGRNLAVISDDELLSYLQQTYSGIELLEQSPESKEE